ncbi:MAG: FtsW/RodA/SpoVE family cell cycle protein [Planctomycetaceae bacterium]|nr:FtsW/RodA/SpoVE family cell cycle protein [Planctomycetaceae bacterium]
MGLCGLVRADELYGRTQLVERQMVWWFLAMLTMFAILSVPYRLLSHISSWFYLLTLVLLAITLFMPPINGSRRWIPLGLFDFQASEPARLAYIMALAAYLMYRSSQRTIPGLLPPLLMAFFPMLLIVREPDLDTALLFLPVLYSMLFAAGAKFRHLTTAALPGLLCLPLFWTQMSAEQQSRIVSVFTQQDGGSTPAGDGFHLHQSKQILALGGFMGSHLQAEPPIDDPAAWQLPASRTDFIFVMIGERFGFPGGACVLLLYCVLVWKILFVAGRTREPFGRLVCVGFVTLIAVQTLLNSGMTVGLLPITGTALPLCSYGGSSLISTYAGIGLVLKIAMQQGSEVETEPFVFGRLSED